MSSDRPVKCPYCKQTFRRSAEEYHFEKGRYWHKECYNLSVKKQQSEIQDRKTLIDFIEKLFNKKVDARINKQIKTFIEDYKYTYKGIHLTLEYFFELKGNSLAKAQGGIGIVPYVYEEAKQHYIMKQAVINKVDELMDTAVTQRVVKIKNPLNRNKYQQNKKININEIVE